MLQWILPLGRRKYREREKSLCLWEMKVSRKRGFERKCNSAV